MIILASRYDEMASALAARWESDRVALLTPADLSVCGWRYYAGAPQAGVSVANGQLVRNDQIGGVLTRLRRVDGRELDHVEFEDRAYVASEMNAFLLAWVSALKCPVLNRPSPESLCGPEWRLERWVRFAAGLGVPVQPVQRDSAACSMPSVDSDALVTVVGGRGFGQVDTSLAGHATRIAAAAGIDLLEVRFTGHERDSRFLNVNLMPDLSNSEVADAVLHYFRGATPCS
jgi:hypothetical protein